MYVKQLSVFLENREGRIVEIFDILKEADINVVSVSLADTSDYGILRMLVNDTDRALQAMKAKGVTCNAADVIAVSIPHTVGSLEKVLAAISEAGINISYMYGLSLGGEGANIAIKTSDLPATVKALEALDVKFYSEEDLKAV